MSIEQQLRDATEAAYKAAESYYMRTFRRPRIRFDLKGATAGMACYGPWAIRYNLPICQDNKDTFLIDTVPHEVAHMLVHELFPYRCKPHGKEWKTVCRNIGMKEVTRCHKYDVKKHVKRHKRPYVYACDCQEHDLTALMHRRITTQGRRYNCRKCTGILKFVKAN